MSCAKKSSMNAVVAPADVALKICIRPEISSVQGDQLSQLTLDTLASTLRMLASMIAPMRARPISRDQTRMSMSTSSNTASRTRREVRRSVPSRGCASTTSVSDSGAVE